MATGKQRRRVEKNGDSEVLIERLRSTRKLRCGLHNSNATPKTATTTPGSKPKVAGGVA